MGINSIIFWIVTYLIFLVAITKTFVIIRTKKIGEPTRLETFILATWANLFVFLGIMIVMAVTHQKNYIPHIMSIIFSCISTVIMLRNIKKKTVSQKAFDRYLLQKLSADTNICEKSGGVLYVYSNDGLILWFTPQTLTKFYIGYTLRNNLEKKFKLRDDILNAYMENAIKNLFFNYDTTRV